MRRSTLRTFGIGAVAVATLFAVPACGSNNDEDMVQVAVEEYLDAVGEQDYNAACGFLHNDARSKLGSDCAGALRQRYGNLTPDVRDNLDDIDVDDVTLKGSTATVASEEVRVASTSKSTSKSKGKKKTKSKTTYFTAPDLTGGAGYTLKKAGEDWKISAGV
jgi:hypothetical protein